MSDTAICPTCGAVARVDRRTVDASGAPRLVAITDEAKGKKIEQLKAAMTTLRAKLDDAERRLEALGARE